MPSGTYEDFPFTTAHDAATQAGFEVACARCNNSHKGIVSDNAPVSIPQACQVCVHPSAPHPRGTRSISLSVAVSLFFNVVKDHTCENRGL